MKQKYSAKIRKQMVSALWSDMTEDQRAGFRARCPRGTPMGGKYRLAVARDIMGLPLTAIDREQLGHMVRTLGEAK